MINIVPIKNNPSFLQWRTAVYLSKAPGSGSNSNGNGSIRIGTLNWQINGGHTYLFAFQFP